MSTNVPLPPVARQPARAGRIALGAILLLLGNASIARVKPEPGDIAGALGSLTGVLILVGLAAWLIGSGLPRSIAPNTDLKKIRRRIWYMLASGGLLLTLVIAFAFFSISWFVGAVLTSWLYWFGWTWIAWLIADKKAVSKVQSKVNLQGASVQEPAPTGDLHPLSESSVEGSLSSDPLASAPIGVRGQERAMNRHQRVIIAIGMVFIVAFGSWPPFQHRGPRGNTYAGQHFLFDPAYASARIDLERLGIEWLLIVFIVGIVLLLYRSISLRALKIIGFTVLVLLLMAASGMLVVKESRRQAHAALTQQARTALAAVTITSRLEENFVLFNPTKWELSAEEPLGSSFAVDYLNVQHVLLYSARSYWGSSLLRAQSEDILKKVAVGSRDFIEPANLLTREEQSLLPQKSPFIQRVTLKYNRATMGNQAAELDPPLELVAERYFVFYPEEWGWDASTQTSYLRGPAEFKEVSSITQKAPARRLAGPPHRISEDEWTPILPAPTTKQHGATRK